MVRKFITAHTEENNENVFKLIDALKENERLRNELAELRNGGGSVGSFSLPPKEVLTTMLQLRDLMKHYRLHTLYSAGLSVMIPGDLR